MKRTDGTEHDNEGVTTESLGALLRQTFGLESFRPLQEEVCREVAAGADALLVMPTGAGKSLCYQLPGLARRGTTIVLSPLIALMEDQVAALQRIGLAAERIHSGRDRLDSRAVCRAYLANELDFLFIAPERLSVPGFPEMLAKRRPALIAVDEAHCISHWGHDFRPDYRMIGDRLPALRPAPVIALTATATPKVQRDIVEQLRIPDAHLYIHGFRRDNIAVEVVEAPPSARRALARKVLADDGRRPAIIYAPSRRETEELAAELGGEVSAAAYHAGMPARRRDTTQAKFADGKLDVIVATIAFGMGIDKADIRTVIHTGLPGSLESYYQEIGRAGRDGLPSRAILLYSWADRHTHQYFLDRDYPDAGVLARVYAALERQSRPAEAIRTELGLDKELFDTALEKLWIHRGAVVDPDENAARGSDDWRAPYEAQRAHRHAQVESMIHFAAGPGCRMAALVRHFGDRRDSGAACGICDRCCGDECVVTGFRRPSPGERERLSAIMAVLKDRDGATSGQLHKELGGGSSRGDFESLLDGLARHGLVEMRADSFVKDERTIRFQRVFLTRSGRLARPGFEDDVRIVDLPAAATDTRRSTPRTRSAAERSEGFSAAMDPADIRLFDALREWRLGEARRRRIPAFRILTDRVLVNICRSRPADPEELLEVSGIGPAIARKYGKPIIECVRQTR